MFSSMLRVCPRQCKTVHGQISIGGFTPQYPFFCRTNLQPSPPPPKETTFTAHLSIFVQNQIILRNWRILPGMKYEGIRQGRVVIKPLKVLDKMDIMAV